MIAALAFAASAGMVAAFNPCGFALLPGYLALFLGSPPSRDSTVRRALLVGGAVTAGFVAVFGALGVAVAALSFSLGPWLSVVTLIAGGVLLVVGLLLLAGRDLSVRIPRATLTVDGSGPGMVAYGIVYATVSLSCTLPVILAAVVFVSSAPGASPLTSAVSGLSYAAGMGLVMTSLALAAGVIGHGVTARARSWTRHVGRVSGGVVLLAALYVLSGTPGSSSSRTAATKSQRVPWSGLPTHQRASARPSSTPARGALRSRSQPSSSVPASPPPSSPMGADSGPDAHPPTRPPALTPPSPPPEPRAGT